MRFLDTVSLQLVSIPDSQLQDHQYAVLSHRWGADEDEVAYEDLVSSSQCSKKGFAKIQGFCQIALAASCRYGWADTCCINKTNTHELNEAINSMYLWYKASKICVVYLEDVPRKEFTESEWFDRGWTLQELIAPKFVSFYDQQWTLIGTKTGLLASISEKTRIPEDVLNHARKHSTCSVAQRMSWAAKRKTTRVEDRAYSLLGLFNLHMPMIYGEREDAFVRLQQLIIQRSKDESIFAWAMDPPVLARRTFCGFYATSPSVYLDCNDIVQIPGSKGFSETNGELSIRLKAFPQSPGTWLAMLHCTKRSRPKERIAIVIARTANKNEYVRVKDHADISRASVLEDHEMYLEYWDIRVSADPIEPPLSFFFGFWVRTLHPPSRTDNLITLLSNCDSSDPEYIYQCSSSQGNTGIARIEPRNGSDYSTWFDLRWIKFGFTQDFDPFLWLANDSQTQRLEESFEKGLVARKEVAEDQDRREIMTGDGFKARRGVTSEKLAYGWPEGRALIVVDKTKGLVDFTIEKLNLSISVQLQPLCKPDMGFSRSPDESGLLPQPMMVWVVDITETRRKSVQTSALTLERQTEDCRRYWTNLFCCPLIFFCHISGECEDRYPPDVCELCTTRNRAEKKLERVKRQYERNANSRVPILTTPDIGAFKPRLGDV